jgi:Protein of unknown function, DUF481
LKRINFIVFVLLNSCVLPGYAQKTDKVYLKNGDIITGEIKSMKLAMLNFKMDGPGTISIKWEEVVGLKSDKIFEITTRWGSITIGRIDSAFLLQRNASLDDIVLIIPIKDRFLRRLNGDVNLGLNYTKSNELFQFNLSSSIIYKIPKLELGLKANSVISSQARDSIFTKKQDLTFSVLKDLDKRLYVGGSLGWQQNTELGLANRFLLNGIGGIEPITNNHNFLLLASGLSYNIEQSVQAIEYTGNLDAIAMVQYKRFYYSTPKLSVDAVYVVYPAITHWGRVRMEFDLDVSVEIFKDFLVGLTFYDNYDSRPPEGASSKNDFGINFKIGYQFGK